MAELLDNLVESVGEFLLAVSGGQVEGLEEALVVVFEGCERSGGF